MSGFEDCAWEDRKRPAVSSEGCENAKKAKTGLKSCGRNLIEPGHPMFVRYNDEVHRSVDFCPLMQTIMDTWPMQRLRDIKQLGTTYLIYSCGNHTRFEHSVGVGFLAREMCRRLQSKYQMFEITDKDVLCVTLAGLLHDIGHGPFSHLYEEFRAEINSDLERDEDLRKLYSKFRKVPTEWSHEQSSIMMIDAVLESLGLEIDVSEESRNKPLREIRNDGTGINPSSIRCYWNDSEENDESQILTNQDWIFIKECIYGEPLVGLGLLDRVGRTEPEKEWLYDIVSNRHNGIDVDKVDYFARDERRTMGEAGNVDISIINEACIAKAKCSNKECMRCKSGKLHYQICYPKKCVSRVIEFYRNRARMHEHVYQHKTTTASGCMVVDILKKADPYFLIPTADEHEGLPISRAFYDKNAFELLRDTIINEIALSKTEELRPARDLAKKFLRRELYKLGSEKVLKTNNKRHQKLWEEARKNPENIVRGICSKNPKHGSTTGPLVLKEQDIIVKCCSWHHGKKDKNPLLFVRFVDKSAPTYARTKKPSDCPVAKEIDGEDHGMSTTREFEKRVIRVFSRDPAKKDLLSHAFESYWQHFVEDAHSYETPAPSVNFGGLQFEEGRDSEDESNGEWNEQEASYAVQLTQDSGDEGDPLSPVRSPGSKGSYFSSPVPVLRRL